MRPELLGSIGRRPLDGEWALAALTPGAAESPAALGPAAPEWIACPGGGPLPAAAALRAAGRWSLDQPRDFDAEDWWFRCRFNPRMEETPARLRFEGLATIADAWLNSVPLVHSESMFVAQEVAATGLRDGDNELLIRCQALRPLLGNPRPRPRWKTRLVADQQLRRYRTTLLGRMPGWCPPVAPVGPWRAVRWVPAAPVGVRDATLRATVEGSTGVVRASVRLDRSDVAVAGATLTVGEATEPFRLTTADQGDVILSGIIRIPDVTRWWPHTHGAQPLYAAHLAIDLGAEPIEFGLGKVGFRTIAIDRGVDGEGFGLRINDADVFCRGACWSPLDIARLTASPSEYRAALLQAREAGMNMIRIGGTMVYEEDAFYDACDELGILVWQDFMFANMDYPSEDPAFSAGVAEEARQFLQRMQGRPSLAVLCGSSEVEQQAAMLGLPEATWTNQLFTRMLPDRCAELAPEVPWIPSTPTGGTHPFQVNRGIAHYYGVGAYLRPLEDARRAGVRFTPECLAFANVPEASTVALVAGASASVLTDPAWKAGVPRDPGVDWDFEDVRDFYLKRLFSVDPGALRVAQPERYLALGRVASGEVMERTIGEWRRPGSSCRGALVWLLRDVVPGAGWGVVDSTGLPKPAWWFLRRAFRPLALIASDEGLNGLFLHVLNEGAASVSAELRVTLFREGSVSIGSARTALTVATRSTTTIHADALFPGFLDLTYAYRFGPPGHQVVAAVLTDAASGEHLAAAFHWPCGLPAGQREDLGLDARAARVEDGYLMTLRSRELAIAVAIRADGYFPDENYLTLEPERPRTILLRPGPGLGSLRGTVAALNGTGPIPIVLDER